MPAIKRIMDAIKWHKAIIKEEMSGRKERRKSARAMRESGGKRQAIKDSIHFQRLNQILEGIALKRDLRFLAIERSPGFGFKPFFKPEETEITLVVKALRKKGFLRHAKIGEVEKEVQGLLGKKEGRPSFTTELYSKYRLGRRRIIKRNELTTMELEATVNFIHGRREKTKQF